MIKRILLKVSKIVNQIDLYSDNSWNIPVSSLNATWGVSRYIYIYQFVDNAKESIHDLHHHYQEMLWETQRCHSWT